MSQATKKHRGIFTRIRHMRGHGIHSPFVYSLVRSVFCGGLRGGELYEALRRAGVGSRTSLRIEKLSKHCGYADFSIGYQHGKAMCVILPDGRFNADMVWESPETTFIIVAPYSADRKIDICLEIASRNHRLTIDSHVFFCIFDHRQPPHQHFRV